MAVEEASLSTWTDSILFGSILLNKSGSVPKGKPSTTIKGADAPLIEPVPRIVIRVSAPTSVSVVEILTPATWPLRASSILGATDFSKTSLDTLVTAFVKFFDF